jgi:hypothetical protein
MTTAFLTGQDPHKNEQLGRSTRNHPYLSHSSHLRLSPETPTPSPSSTRPGHQRCSTTAHSHISPANPSGSTIDPAGAPGACAARTLAAKVSASSLVTAREADKKAAKRRCEVELLRDVGVEDDFYVSPPLLMPPLAQSPPLNPTPSASLITEQSHCLSDFPKQRQHRQVALLTIPPQLRLLAPSPRRCHPQDCLLRRHRRPS